MPDFSIETECAYPVCGIDEVGRGPLAGPVVAACVYIPETIRAEEWIAEIKDSKKLSENKLNHLFEQIYGSCPHGIGILSPQEIDRMNILQASLKAMEKAYITMNTPMAMALIDGNKLPDNLPCPARAIVKGDHHSTSIAAASIVAKVTRDRIMRDLAAKFPHYGWESNVGYPSKKHKDALAQYGITPHHRKSYAPVAAIIKNIKIAS